MENKTVRTCGILLLFAFVALCLTGCAGSPPSRPVPPEVPVEEVSVQQETVPEVEGTALSVPARYKGVLASADSAVIADIEMGTPVSLRRAADKLMANRSADETSKMLLAVAGGIFDVLYPLEKRTWDIPAVSRVTVYTDAIESARLGIYESPRGTEMDFLSLTLPSLVLVTAPSLSDYFDNAESSLKHALSLNPHSPLALYLLGLLYQRRNMPREAAESLSLAWQLDPSCYPAGAALAAALTDTGKPRDGYAVAKALLDAYPDNMEFLKLCAQTAIAAKDWQLAEQYVSLVLQRDPSNTAFLLFRIRILVENGEYLKASSLLDAYSRTEKTSKEYLLLRTRIQQEWNKNLTSASATIQDALRLYPDDIEVLLAAAELSVLTGQKLGGTSASDLIGKALSINPDSPEGLVLAVKAAVQRADWTTAMTLGKKLVTSRPSLESNLLYISACLGGGAVREALDLSRKLYAENPQNEDVVQMYVRSLTASGDAATASSVIENRLSAATPRFRSILYYERSRLAANDDQKLSDLRSSLNSNPRNQDSLFALYRFYYDKKDYRKAQYYLKQVVAMSPADASLLKLQNEIELLLAQ